MEAHARRAGRPEPSWRRELFFNLPAERFVWHEILCTFFSSRIIKFQTMCVCVGKGFRLYRLFSHVQLTGFGVFFVHPPPVPVCLQATLWWSVAKRLDCERASTPVRPMRDGGNAPAARRRGHEVRWTPLDPDHGTRRGWAAARSYVCSRQCGFRVRPPDHHTTRFLFGTAGELWI